MRSPTTIQIADLYGALKSQLYTAAAALFFNGICLLLFSFAVSFLLKTKTQASRLFLGLSIILLLFAITQAMLDVALATMFSHMVETIVTGSPTDGLTAVEATWARAYVAREALMATNNAVSDGLVLYRCYIIWGTSPWTKIVVAVPFVLILATLITGYYYTFAAVDATTIPYALALVTNLVLLGLTAGRIWRKGRQASIMMGVNAGRRYNMTLEVICESSFLFVVVVFTYIISAVTAVSPFAPLTNLAWGALAQVINIVPMMIFVRVGIAKDFGSRDTHEFHAVGGGQSAMSLPLVGPVSRVKGFHGPYSESDV
ncbi:hypothetical protein C8R43DRAFT_1017143 [Mycena crocata]|nr:hypothetical protein C8R43DRAFT_1017143 [Mycena crocata]